MPLGRFSLWFLMSMLSCMKQPVILTLHEWLEIPFSFKLGWSMWMGRGASSSYLLALTHPVDHPSSCHPNKCFSSKWTYPSKLHLLQWSDLLMFAQGRESECSCTAGLPKRHWEDSRAGFWDCYLTVKLCKLLAGLRSSMSRGCQLCIYFPYINVSL